MKKLNLLFLICITILCFSSMGFVCADDGKSYPGDTGDDPSAGPDLESPWIMGLYPGSNLDVPDVENVNVSEIFFIFNESMDLTSFTINSSTTKVDTRARARAVSVKVANTGTSQDWKLGTFRLDIQPDGRR